MQETSVTQDTAKYQDNFDYERAAAIVTTAVMEGNKIAVAQYGITVRTIQRYKIRLNKDGFLSRLVAEKKMLVDSELINSINEMNTSVIQSIQRVAEEGNLNNPEVLDSVAKACVSVNETYMQGKMLDVRLEQLKQIREGPGQVVTATPRARAAISDTTN